MSQKDIFEAIRESDKYVEDMRQKISDILSIREAGDKYLRLCEIERTLQERFEANTKDVATKAAMVKGQVSGSQKKVAVLTIAAVALLIAPGLDIPAVVCLLFVVRKAFQLMYSRRQLDLARAVQEQIAPKENAALTPLLAQVGGHINVVENTVSEFDIRQSPLRDQFIKALKDGQTFQDRLFYAAFQGTSPRAPAATK